MQKGYAALTVTIGFLLLSVGGIAWIANIVKLAHTDCGLCGMQILRIVGIFLAPLGAVLGFL